MRMRFLSQLFLVIPAASAAQPVVQRPGPYLFVLDLQGTALDEFPDAVKALNGVMTVVNVGGQHMLRATSPSELLITLPQMLPPVFTVEVDLIPKRCCQPDDIMVEGTPARNRGGASAELTWHPAHISVVGGGGDMYQSDMPTDLAASTPGNLTHLVMEMNGTTIKLWTNGRRMYTLDKQFVRGRVLRVWLGGEDASNPMYLAGLRVGTGPVAPGVIAVGAGLPGASGGAPNSGQPGSPPPPPGVAAPGTGTGGGGTNPPPPSQPPPISSRQPTPSVPKPGQSAPSQPAPPSSPITPPNRTVQNGGTLNAPAPSGPASLTTIIRPIWGVTLKWDALPSAVGYQVDRRLVSTGSSFTLLAGVDATANPSVGGYHSFDDVTILPNTQYEYRVMGLFASGPFSAWSPVASYGPLTQIPQISNLIETMSGPFQATNNLSAPQQRAVTWTWNGIPGAVTYEISVEVLTASSAGGWGRVSYQLQSLPASTSPPYTANVDVGKRVQLCVGIIRPYRPTDPITYGTCRITDVP